MYKNIRKIFKDGDAIHIKYKVFYKDVAEGVAKGTIASYIHRDRIYFKAISGCSPHASWFMDILRQACEKNNIPISDMIKELTKIHYYRKYPWRVERYVGSSGYINYSVYELLDTDYIHGPATDNLHVSIYGNLNEEISIQIKNLLVFLKLLKKDLDDQIISDADKGDVDKILIQIFKPDLLTFTNPNTDIDEVLSLL